MSNFNEHPEAYAKKHGLVICPPYPNELQVDIDARMLPPQFDECLQIIAQFNKVVNVSYTTSKSGNLHVYVELEKNVSDHARIALQACLGSDPKREALTFYNTTMAENKMPQFLFELKDAVKRNRP